MQTILHSLIGRVRCPWPIGGRISLILPDRSTLTYDLYEPVGSEHEGKSEIQKKTVCAKHKSLLHFHYLFNRRFVHYAGRSSTRIALSIARPLCTLLPIQNETRGEV